MSAENQTQAAGSVPRLVMLVKQQEPNGCGIACAAMLAGVSYETAKAKVIEMGFRQAGSHYGLLPREVIRLASELGAVVAPDIAPTAIQIRRGERNHFVVITKTGEIYDPA